MLLDSWLLGNVEIKDCVWTEVCLCVCACACMPVCMRVQERESIGLSQCVFSSSEGLSGKVSRELCWSRWTREGWRDEGEDEGPNAAKNYIIKIGIVISSLNHLKKYFFVHLPKFREIENVRALKLRLVFQKSYLKYIMLYFCLIFGNSNKNIV